MLVIPSMAALAAAQVEPLTPDFVVNTTTDVPAYLSDGGRPGHGTIAMTPDGRFVVVWYSPHDGSGQGVFAQRFANDAAPVGDEFLVNTFTGNPGGGDQKRGVNIALGNQPLDQCLAFDPNGDMQVAINELLRGVNNALNGCPRA